MEKRGRGRPGYNQTPEQAALCRRARRHMRTPRPGPRSPQEYWIRAFVELHDLAAWEVLCPPMTRSAWLKHYGISSGTLRNYRLYLRTFDAAVEAGMNPYPLRFVPYSHLMKYARVAHQPNVLLGCLAGKQAVKVRKRKQANHAARRRMRRRKSLTPAHT